MEERDVSERVVEVADQERGHNEEEEQWIWRNGLLVRVKSRIEVLTKKVDSFNSSIEKTSNTNSPYLKDMMDLNTELTGYFSSLTDNVNIRDLFDFLSICFYEYEHFFKEFRSEIYLKVLILEINFSLFNSPSRRKSGPSSSLSPMTSCTTISRRSWSSSTTTRSTILLE